MISREFISDHVPNSHDISDQLIICMPRRNFMLGTVGVKGYFHISIGREGLCNSQSNYFVNCDLSFGGLVIIQNSRCSILLLT